MTFTVQGGHANIKKALGRILGDLPMMARLIREQIGDQYVRVQSPVVRTRRRGRPQNPQREPPAFEIAQAPRAAARAQNGGNVGGGWGGDEGQNGRRRGTHQGRFDRSDGRGGNGVRNPSREGQPRRISLRRRVRFQDGISDYDLAID